MKVIIFLFISIMCINCHGDSSSQNDSQQTENRIRQRITTYFSYMQSGQFDKAWEMSSKKTKKSSPKEKAIDEMRKTKMHLTLDKIHKVEILDVDYTEVTVTASACLLEKGIIMKEPHKVKFGMVSEDGDWYVDRMLPPAIDEEVLESKKIPSLNEIRRIGEAKERRGFSILKKIVETHKSKEFRIEAIDAMVKLQLPYKEVLSILVKILKEDPDLGVRNTALRALPEIKKKAVVPIVISCLADNSYRITALSEMMLSYSLTGKGSVDYKIDYFGIEELYNQLKKTKDPIRKQEIERQIHEKEKVALKLKSEYEKRWQKNKDYLYWRYDYMQIEIDEEAKKNKIPIDEKTRKPLAPEEIKKWREEEKEIEKMKQELEKVFQQQKNKYNQKE